MKPQVEFLLAAKHLALYGLTRANKGFAREIFTTLRAYRPDLQITAVHPNASEFKDVPAAKSAAGLQPPADKAMIVLGPSDAAHALKDADAAGIKQVWLVMNAADSANRELVQNSGMEMVGGCPLLFIPDVKFPHNLHRGLAKLFGNV